MALAAAAASLLLAGVATAGPDDSMGAKAGEVKCAGVNSCKGQTNCKSATNNCKNQNSCKGKGWISMSKADCDAKGGKVI
jgi:uncharacterized membrane protein